ncbi:MAG: hypothetical protein M5U26_28690 [Planctomycetota bacterium]|nr:hypothetical protein [Planctomycetota bacterium]
MLRFTHAALLVAFIAVHPVAGEEPDVAGGRFVWRAQMEVKRADGVFPDPADPDRCLVATREGLMESRDDGLTWTALPNSDRAALGRVADLCFARLNPRLVYLGSRDLGVFKSEDGGRTWASIGNEQGGLASNAVARLRLYPGDLSMRTLYVTHGAGVAGISKTMDGGKTWTVIAQKHFADEILFSGTTGYMGGGAMDEEDVWGIYRSHDGGRYWSELIRDVRPTVGLLPRFKPDDPWFGTRGGRLMRVESWESVGPEASEDAEWVSLFQAWGDKPDETWIYAYDPHSRGLLASKDGFKTWFAENEGLFIDRLVKSGANAAANANGSTLYASVNGQLYVARRVVPPGPQVARLRAEPGSLVLPYWGYRAYMGGLRAQFLKLADARHAGHMALGMREKLHALAEWSKGVPVTFTAKVNAAGDAPIKAVTLDLRPLLGEPTALLDDGQHGDGEAGDGVYGASMVVGPRAMAWSADQDSGGPKLPGQLPLTLTATDEKGRSTSGVLVFAAWPRQEDMGFWDGEDNNWGRAMAAEGEVDLTVSEVQARNGERCLRLHAKSGPWAIAWGVDRWGDSGGAGRNITEQDALVFWVKSPAPSDRDVRVCLMDMTDHWSSANRTREVWLLKDGYLKSFTAAYQRVRVPLADIMKQTAFFPDKCGALVFAGDDPDGHQFYIDDIGFEVERDRQ